MCAVVVADFSTLNRDVIILVSYPLTVFGIISGSLSLLIGLCIGLTFIEDTISDNSAYNHLVFSGVSICKVVGESGSLLEGTLCMLSSISWLELYDDPFDANSICTAYFYFLLFFRWGIWLKVGKDGMPG